MAESKAKKNGNAVEEKQEKIPGTKPKFDNNNAHKNKSYTTTTRIREGNAYVPNGLKLPPKKEVKKEEPKKKTLINKDGWLVIHVGISVLLLVSVMGFGGVIGGMLKRLQIGLFGIVGNVFPLIYGYCTYFLLSSVDKKKAKKKLIVIGLLLISVTSAIFLMVDESLTDAAKLMEFYLDNSACGVIGGLFGGLAKNMLSRVGGFIVFLVLLLFSVFYLSNKSLHETIQTQSFSFSGIVNAWNRFKDKIESRFYEDEEDDTDYGIEVDEELLDRYEPEYFEEVEADERANAIRAQREAQERRAQIRRNRKKKVRGVDFSGLEMKPLTNSQAVLNSTAKARQIAKKRGFAQEEETDFFGGVSILKKSGLFADKVEEDAKPRKGLATTNLNQVANRRRNRGVAKEDIDSLLEENDRISDELDLKKEFEVMRERSEQDNGLPFDERMITAEEDLTKKSGFSTPEESIRPYRADVYEGSLVKPRKYDEATLFDDTEDNLDEETIRKVKAILARRGEIVLTKEARAKEPIQAARDTKKTDSMQVAKSSYNGNMLHYDEVDDNVSAVDELGIKAPEIVIHHYPDNVQNEGAQRGSNKKEEVVSDDIFEEDIWEEDVPLDEGYTLDSDYGFEKEVIYHDVRDDFAQRSRNADAVQTREARQSHADVVQTRDVRPSHVDTDRERAQSIRVHKEEIPYMFPPNSLLAKNPKPRGGINDEEFRQTGLKLQQTLKNFGVNVTVTDISIGPVVTRYELQPEQGVKVNKIVSLADDLKLSLAAKDIRIQAPIPGKPAVGIEVPNKESSIVYFRDLIETEEFRSDKYKIAFAIGKDIAGKPMITDITNMPHLLIAGATGSGKSVCINTIIMSILYKYSPADVRMIMIDPKVVELSVYNGIPHLLIPVVTEAKKAAGALNWAVAEMTDRFKKFAEVGVRNIKGYNKKIEDAAKKVDVSELPEKMPNIVIIIDELADLMMVAHQEVENSICRIAQLARACGIHLVIATQRPSVNVITGLIKANIPTRIAFAVSSSTDSRTILDVGGAEKLLGKGDMLFNPPGGIEHIRIQGAFISDNEVQEVVDYVKNQGFEAKIDEETVTNIENIINTFGDGQSGGEDERDELFASVGRYIVKKKKASKGNLQIVFKIGFNRSARIFEQLHQAGVVGDDLGTKPRDVLMNEAQFEELLQRLNLS